MRSKKAIGIMLAVIMAVSVFTLIAIALSATEQNKVGSVPEKNQVEHDIEKLPLDEYLLPIISGDPEFMPGGAIIEFKPNVSVNISTGQGNKKLGTGIIPLGTQTIIIYNASNSFPMFSNAEYVNFTIGNDTINLTLDSNASYDGVCNLSNLTGTNISAAGSFAELNYSSVTYQTGTYDQKWESAPYFNDTENRLYLLSGSGDIAVDLRMKENVTAGTIPKVVGVGDLVGHFQIQTVAHGKNSTYNELDSSMQGTGYADLYVQYAPDTSYENTPFIPTFLDCEKLQLITGSIIEPGISSTITSTADVLGIASGVEYLIFNNMPLDNVAINEAFDLEYHPVNILGDLFDEKWSVEPVQYDDILVILRGTGTMTKLNFTFNDSNAAHPEIISYGYLRGDYNLTANILPHYMNVIANGTKVSAMDESGRGGFGITFAVPIITSFAPPSPVNDTVCTWRTFNVTVNQTVNVSWYLNNTLQHTNVSVTEADYTLHAEFVGDNNVSAVATNANGTDMQTWIWNVVPTTVTIPTATGSGNAIIETSSGYFCDETAALNASDFPSLPDSTITFPHGFFNITICGLNTSNPENVTINFTFPSAIPTNAEFWKYNSSTGTWYRYQFGDNDGDNVISITITDNGAGDHNPALGVINDPNGIGWRMVKVPALTPIGMLALIGILSAVLAVATSRRRK